ncbi:DNA helicase RecQ [Ferrovibrio terrae]|uniref:DNA helicase RecQ n=1 Tax=Ferrovibrio terrae TaxID=2594003 RepID=A0A516H6M1_9PROT|nr:DNA helicase RecQ [Ferrovibrio terrae]QDO99408.1 DNA helicase RecQ [Ferrovibrio terrae]
MGSSSLDAAESTLHRVFGFERFRAGQAEIVQVLLEGEDVLAVMPTGSGKSLCYQLPAILSNGLTVVVSPLIALMRDQVRQLQGFGVNAASLNSANDEAENQRVYRDLREGTLRLLYVAPERLVRSDTVALLKRSGANLLAIDEAHCVSQWGHDFRPEYLALGQIRAELGDITTIALTATADAPTRADIVQKLFATSPRTFIRSFDRPNLHLMMLPKASAKKQIGDFIAARRGMSGIVYCSSRKRTEDLAAGLNAMGHTALAYHAGMEQRLRDANQDTFLREDGVVMVATVAFGMGIDKPDVRFVCHADMPRNVEAYYQEIGRAGRDGLPAETMTLYGLDDMRLRRLQIEEGEASDERKRIERQRFNALIALCESPRCRRQTLLAYFGESSEPCGHCDLCQDGVARFDGTTEAQKALSAMMRTGQRYGTEHLVQILLGNTTDAILRSEHDRLPTFGVGKDRDANSWRSIFRQLYGAGLIELDIAGHGGWFITDAGRLVLRGQSKVEMRQESLSAKRDRSRRSGSSMAETALQPSDQRLLSALKNLRRQLAAELQQPAYVIFSDRTLLELAAKRPTSLYRLTDIHGIGQAKLERFGQAFLDVVLAHEDDRAA